MERPARHGGGVGFRRARRLGMHDAGLLTVDGCSLARASYRDPAGPVTLAAGSLLRRVTMILRIVVLPVFVLTAVLVTRYRASRHKSDDREDWSSSLVDGVIRTVSALIILILARQLWHSKYRLDPYLKLEGAGAARETQVVAQDWKWLFIYEEQGGGSETTAGLSNATRFGSRPNRHRGLSDSWRVIR